MSAVIEKLDASGYRKFGLTTGVIIAVLFGFIIPWLFDFNYPYWPLIIAAVLGGLALVVPMALQPVYIVWMKFGNVMNWINTRIILGILFYGLFLPIGIVLKLLGKDSMRRKFDNKLSSYRVISNNESKDNIERPY